MAGLGLTDDILPWTPDSYGQSTEVAPTGGLGLAADPTPAPSPEAAQATIMDIPASQVPGASPDWAGGGGGIERAMQPGKGDAERQQRQATIDKALGTWDENPVRRLAFVLQAGLAGFAGQKPAYLGAIEREEQREANNLKKALTSIQVIEHTQKAAAKLDPEKKKAFLDSTKKQFAMLGPEFGAQLDAAVSGRGASMEQLKALTDDPSWYMNVANGDLAEALELAKNPGIRKIAEDRADSKNAKIIPQKLATLQERAMALAGQDPGFQRVIAGLPKGPQGQTFIPIGMIEQLKDLLPAEMKLSGSEMNSLRRNDELAFASGVMPAKMEMKIAENAITNKPEIVRLQDAYNAAIAGGDGQTAQLVKRQMQKMLRDDPKSPITLTGPDGELRTLPADSAEAQSLMKDGWVQATEYTAGQKLYQDANGVAYMATPLQARRFKLMPVEKGQTIETEVNGQKVKISSGNFNVQAYGTLPAIGASAAPGPVMIGPVDPATESTAPGGDGPGSAGAAPAPGATPGGTPPSGGGTPEQRSEAPAPLTQGAAGNAAPLVRPAIPGATVIAAPARREIAAPKQALPPAMQEKLTSGITMLGFLDMAERGVAKTGGIQGAISAAKADPFWGNFIPGDARAENALGNAFNQLKVSSQAIIKGVPSNFDIQTVIDTFPKFWASQGFNQAAIAGSKKIVAQMLVDTMSFNQKDYKIPGEVREQIKALGVDPAKLKVWQGGDALSNTYSTWLETRPGADLKADIQAAQRGANPVSKWQYDAMIDEARRRQAARGKK